MNSPAPAAGLPCPTLHLAGLRAQLRAWQATDAASLLSAFSDEEIQRFSWPHSREYRAADAEDYLAEQERDRLAGAGVQWAIVETTSGRLAGCVSLYEVEPAAGRASVGYWVASHARRRGLAGASVDVVARWAFTFLGLSRLQLTCGPDNIASQAVAAHCGFTREGMLRSHTPFKGGRRDTVIFSLLAQESAALRQGR